MRTMGAMLIALTLALLFSLLISPQQDMGALGVQQGTGTSWEVPSTSSAQQGTLNQRFQARATVTKTFSLVLYGNVPDGESFGVEYNQPSEGEVQYFCGPQTAVACIGNGTIYTRTATFPPGFNLYFRFFRGFTKSPNFEQIDDGWETLSSDITNVASYSFDDTGQGNTTQNIPNQLPDTGARLPLANIAVGIALLLVSGYALHSSARHIT